MNKAISECKRTQVILFAGGMGKRFGTRKPKPLLMLNGKSLIERCVEFFMNSGFEDFVFLLGYGADEVLRHIKKFCSNFRYSIDPALSYGRANSLLYALKNGSIDRRKRAFISYPDDILFGEKLAFKILEKHIDALKDGILASVVLSEGIEFPYGVADIDGRSLVRNFREKPFLPLKVSVGAYVIEKDVFGIMGKLRGKEIETSLFPYLAGLGKLYGIVIPKGCWVPVNTRKDLENAKKLLKQNKG
jgi:NDP-sugar pyrophosphorylase family protein